MHTFKVQILTSPGIRKDIKEEQELGEDAAGFVSINDYAILWVADGATGTKIEINGIKFSSRTLAQCMGECFEKVVLKDEIPKKPFNDKFLEKFVCELDKQLFAKLEDLNKQLVQMKDSINYNDVLEINMKGKEKTYSLMWSVTFVGAVINLKNKVCHTVSIGDCMALVNDDVLNTNKETDNNRKQEILKIITEKSIIKIITDKSNRFFMKYFTPENLDLGDIELIKNKPRYETINNVESLILMSDGVINYNDIVHKFENKDIHSIWHELKLMNNKTDDDKTAIFFKIIG